MTGLDATIARALAGYDAGDVLSFDSLREAANAAQLTPRQLHGQILHACGAEAETRNLATPTERRRYYRRPCPSGKRKYATESQARTELVGALVGANSGDGKRHEKRVYECPACGHWHLTSKPAMSPRKVREP